MTIYKADRVAADRAMNAACRRAIAEIRAGRPAVAELALYVATLTAGFLLGEDV